MAKKSVINLEPIKEANDFKDKPFSLRQHNFQVDELKKHFIRPIDWCVDEYNVETREMIDYAHSFSDLPHLQEKQKVLKNHKYVIVKLYEESK